MEIALIISFFGFLLVIPIYFRNFLSWHKAIVNNHPEWLEIQSSLKMAYGKGSLADPNIQVRVISLAFIKSRYAEMPTIAQKSARRIRILLPLGLLLHATSIILLVVISP